MTEDKRSFIIKVYQIFIYSLIFSAMASYAGVQIGIQFAWWWIVLDIAVFLICLLIRDNIFLLYCYATINGFTSSPILVKITGLGNADII